MYKEGDCIEFTYARGDRAGRVRQMMVHDVNKNHVCGFDFDVGESRSYVTKYMSDIKVLDKTTLSITGALYRLKSASIDSLMAALQKENPERFYCNDGRMIIEYSKPVVTVVEEWSLMINSNKLVFQKLSDGTVREVYPYRGTNPHIKNFIKTVVTA